MFKVIALIKAKPDISREQFVAHYEQRHVPLVLRLMPQVADYRRNYVEIEGAYLASGVPALDFDAVTELRYRCRADYEAAVALLQDPEIRRVIVEDEEHFLDRERTRLFVVEEVVSKI